MAHIFLATASYDRSIKLWKVNPPEQTRSFSFQDSQVNCLAISPDRTRLAAAGYVAIRVYDLTALAGDGAHAQTAAVSTTQEGAHANFNVTALGFVRTPQGPHLLFSASEDGTWKLWDARSQVLRLRRGVDVREPINTAVSLQNNLLLCGTQLGTISLWNLSSSASAQQQGTSSSTNGNGAAPANPSKDKAADTAIDSVHVNMEDPAVRSITVVPGGEFAVAGTNSGRVFVYAIKLKAKADGSSNNSLASKPAANASIADSSNVGSPLTMDNGPPPTLDQTSRGEQQQAAADAAVTVTAEGADGTTTTAPVMNVSMASSSQRAEGDPAANRAPSAVSGVSAEDRAAPNASVTSMFATTSDTLRLVWTFEAHSRYVLRACVSPNSAILCTTSADCTVALWRVPDLKAHLESGDGTVRQDKWQLARTLTGHQRWVWDAAFSRCSGYVVTASSDHTGKLWNTETGRLEATFNGHQKPVTCVILDDKRDP